MRSTFFVLLITLLLAFYGILGLTLVMFPPIDVGSPANVGEGLKTALLNEAFLEHGLYLRDGCESHERMLRAGTIIKLAEPHGDGFSILCGGTVSPAFAAVLRKAIAKQALANGPDGAYWVVAYPFRIPDGRQLIMAQYSLQVKNVWSPWPKTFLPLAAIVCALVAMGLAYFFSRPVRDLRAVVRSFADGKLETRVREPRLRVVAAGTSEIRSLMMDFNQMADRITALMDAQKLLLRDVSHELRSPLARMSVALEMARDDAPVSTAVHLQRIEDEADQLNRLIAELLSLSSMESLLKPISVESISLVSLIERCLPNLRFEAGFRGCSITLDGAIDIAAIVNPDLLGRAIENIVRNAIRYSAAGSSIELEVTSEIGLTANKAVIRIMDRGPGIPDELRESVFRPFVRVDASRSDDTGGFGVGLAIAERAIHLHNGVIRALPRTGGGLIIEITLPADTSAFDHTAPISEAPQSL